MNAKAEKDLGSATRLQVHAIWCGAKQSIINDAIFQNLYGTFVSRLALSKGTHMQYFTLVRFTFSQKVCVVADLGKMY